MTTLGDGKRTENAGGVWRHSLEVSFIDMQETCFGTGRFLTIFVLHVNDVTSREAENVFLISKHERRLH